MSCRVAGARGCFQAVLAPLQAAAARDFSVLAWVRDEGDTPVYRGGEGSDQGRVHGRGARAETASAPKLTKRARRDQ